MKNFNFKVHTRFNYKVFKYDVFLKEKDEIAKIFFDLLDIHPEYKDVLSLSNGSSAFVNCVSFLIANMKELELDKHPGLEKFKVDNPEVAYYFNTEWIPEENKYVFKIEFYLGIKKIWEIYETFNVNTGNRERRFNITSQPIEYCITTFEGGYPIMMFYELRRIVMDYIDFLEENYENKDVSALGENVLMLF